MESILEPATQKFVSQGEDVEMKDTPLCVGSDAGATLPDERNKKRKLEELEAHIDGELKKLKNLQSQIKQHQPDCSDSAALSMDSESEALVGMVDKEVANSIITFDTTKKNEGDSDSDGDTDSDHNNSNSDSDTDSNNNNSNSSSSDTDSDEEEVTNEEGFVGDKMDCCDSNNNNCSDAVPSTAEQSRLRNKLLFLARTKLLTKRKQLSAQLFYRMTNIHIERTLSTRNPVPPPLIVV